MNIYDKVAELIADAVKDMTRDAIEEALQAYVDAEIDGTDINGLVADIVGYQLANRYHINIEDMIRDAVANEIDDYF